MTVIELYSEEKIVNKIDKVPALIPVGLHIYDGKATYSKCGRIFKAMENTTSSAFWKCKPSPSRCFLSLEFCYVFLVWGGNLSLERIMAQPRDPFINKRAKCKVTKRECPLRKSVIKITVLEIRLLS